MNATIEEKLQLIILKIVTMSARSGRFASRAATRQKIANIMAAARQQKSDNALLFEDTNDVIDQQDPSLDTAQRKVELEYAENLSKHYDEVEKYVAQGLEDELKRRIKVDLNVTHLRSKIQGLTRDLSQLKEVKSEPGLSVGEEEQRLVMNIREMLKVHPALIGNLVNDRTLAEELREIHTGQCEQFETKMDELDKGISWIRSKTIEHVTDYLTFEYYPKIAEVFEILQEEATKEIDVLALEYDERHAAQEEALRADFELRIKNLEEIAATNKSAYDEAVLREQNRCEGLESRVDSLQRDTEARLEAHKEALLREQNRQEELESKIARLEKDAKAREIAHSKVIRELEVRLHNAVDGSNNELAAAAHQHTRTMNEARERHNRDLDKLQQEHDQAMSNAERKYTQALRDVKAPGPESAQSSATRPNPILTYLATIHSSEPDPGQLDEDLIVKMTELLNASTVMSRLVSSGSRISNPVPDLAILGDSHLTLPNAATAYQLWTSVRLGSTVLDVAQVFFGQSEIMSDQIPLLPWLHDSLDVVIARVLGQEYLTPRLTKSLLLILQGLVYMDTIAPYWPEDQEWQPNVQQMQGRVNAWLESRLPHEDENSIVSKIHEQVRNILLTKQRPITSLSPSLFTEFRRLDSRNTDLKDGLALVADVTGVLVLFTADSGTFVFGEEEVDHVRTKDLEILVVFGRRVLGLPEELMTMRLCGPRVKRVVWDRVWLWKKEYLRGVTVEDE